MKAVGIILSGGNSTRMKELTRRRAIAAMPFGGTFRCVDFALSNMSNSHISSVAVITQFNARSLNAHLSSSKWWDFGRKQGGMFLFPPTVTRENSDWYRGTADAMCQNIEFLKRSFEPYVIIASGDGVYKLDYEEVLDYHIQTNADITVVCKKIPQESDFSRYGVIETDDEGRITSFDEKPLVPKSNIISTGIYVIGRLELIALLEKAEEECRYSFVNDIIIRYLNAKRVMAYEMEGYWKNISTVSDYYQANMDLLNPKIRAFFSQEPKIYSKVDDLPPAKYNPGASVSDSLISSGCIINGQVEGSLLFKKVFVGKDSVIKNSIILNEVYIADNVRIENCIVESKTQLSPNTSYIGEGDIKIVSESNLR